MSKKTQSNDSLGDRMKMDMLMAKGINWNDYPASFKRGTYVRRVSTMRKLTDGELATIPAKHRDRVGTVTRSSVESIDIPPASRLVNYRDVIVSGDVPCVRSE